MALIHCQFFSEILGLSTAMDVILPQNTEQQIGLTGKAGSGDHPCLLLLHGLSDDHTVWQRRTSIERYATPLGLAVVMPAVHRSFYTDQKHGYDYWTFISEEVLDTARSFFRLSDKREDNFVAGLSMGGYGAFKLALRCPEKFQACASLSGALDIASRTQDEYKNSKDITVAFGRHSDIAGTDNDLMKLADSFVQRKDISLKFFQCCGTGDHLYKENARFREHALKLGLDLTYEEGPGEHEWGYWDTMIQKVLRWLPLT